VVFALPGRVLARKTLPPILWFQQPAAQWNDALPIGNGRMGAMIFGGVPDERIQFNQDTLWRGEPHDYVRPGARAQLPVLRQLLFEGKTDEAAQIAKEKFLSDPVRQMPYQPFGDLHFHFIGLTNFTDYRRELDLDSAIASVTYRAGGVSYERDAFASYPDNVIVLRLTADKKGRVSFTLGMDSPQTNSETQAISPDTLALRGRVQPGGLRFESRVRVMAEGGQITTNGNAITVLHANTATVLLVAATSFKNFQDISGHPGQRCARALARLKGKSYQTLLARHLADYQSLFDRVHFDLGRVGPDELPTDERLARAKKFGLEGDPSLAALYFQYGRYLLIASSRPGGQPANLQGIWNEELDPPWESKWTLNINCEMNYWPAEVANLAECAQPLFAMINDLAISGHRTAREHYGCGGWVVNHNTDLWRGTAPINGIDGIWPTGGAWLCHCLWEYYLFTGDTNFLARYYPDLKGASQFFVDFLIRDPATGWLVTSPSYSPEHGPLCYGPTMDNQLIRALFNSTIAAAGILGKDQAFAGQLAKLRGQLPPNQVGKYGQLQEWITDIDKPFDNHRHMSPLWALYPGSAISPADPKIWNAARLLLKWRGDGSTGWSYAWRIPLWARAGDGEFAWRQLNLLFQRKTLPNLFDLCGPFQIDGNFGATAGMVEMLLQSQWTEMRNGRAVRVVRLLPALPKEWPSGSISGICARDGFVADLAWENGQLTHAVIHSKLGRPCLLRYGGREIELQTDAGKTYAFNGQLKSITP
ncbi:MAG: glycosyl hydrolase family 95 catalytic domain-containing protein, partial [Limisphaerales bacterium]